MKASTFVLLLVFVVAAGAAAAYFAWRPRSASLPLLITPTPSRAAPRVTATPPALPPPVSSAGGRRFVGVMGATSADFPFIKSWGADTVEYHNAASSSDLQSVFNAAKASSLNIFFKGPSRERIQGSSYKLDLSRVTAETRRYFDGTTVPGDPALVGFWIVDEPCHDNKWELTGSDLRDLYNTVKAVNTGIPVLINFGTLECFQNIIATAQPGWKLVDVATFTITIKKTGQRRVDYIADQAKIAQSAKDFDPAIIVLPNIAVLEFIEVGAAIPTADWVRSNGLRVLSYPSFNGLMFYSYRSLAPWMGQTIINVKDDPDYSAAFKDVFAAAHQP